jgi:hypothetical protein
VDHAVGTHGNNLDCKGLDRVFITNRTKLPLLLRSTLKLRLSRQQPVVVNLKNGACAVCVVPRSSNCQNCAQNTKSRNRSTVSAEDQPVRRI